MPKKYFIGLDQGTTGITALLLDENWDAVARGYKEISQIYPCAGWVEHDAEEIWQCTCETVRQVITAAGLTAQDTIACIGIDHEGESVVLWDRETGIPIYNAVIWQDRRTSQMADELKQKHQQMILDKTGLIVDAYFSATKIQWILQNVERAKELAQSGRLLAGTMDTWLVWKMTGGRVHITDASTASRTMLFNIHTGSWDQDLLDLMEIDRRILPEVCDSAQLYGYTDPEAFLGLKVAISGVLVDQQAALFGQTCLSPGTVKTTYGTGCFMLMNTGETPTHSENGLLTSVAWQLNGKRTYCLDGAIYISGAAIQWLRDGLKIVSSASETERRARSVQDTNGVYFVPSFTGLAAPYWDSYARGTMVGITAGTTQEHIIRAALEATAYQVKDVLDHMVQDTNVPISVMRCDGGATANGFLMQFQSDILGIPLDIPKITETTALGAAYMAALGVGEFSSPEEICKNWVLDRCFEPRMSADQRESMMFNWHRAVERARNWALD